MLLNKLKKVAYWINIILPFVLVIAAWFFTGGLGLLAYYLLALAILYSATFLYILKKNYTNIFFDITAGIVLSVFLCFSLVLLPYPLGVSFPLLDIAFWYMISIFPWVGLILFVFWIAGVFVAIHKTGNFKMLAVSVLFALMMVFFFPKNSGEFPGFFEAHRTGVDRVEANCFGLRAESYPSGVSDAGATIYCLGIPTSPKKCFGKNNTQVACP